MWRGMASWARGSKSDLTGLPNIGIRDWRKLTGDALSLVSQRVFIPGATKDAGGALQADRITVGKDGMVPPM